MRLLFSPSCPCVSVSKEDSPTRHLTPCCRLGSWREFHGKLWNKSALSIMSYYITWDCFPAQVAPVCQLAREIPQPGTSLHVAGWGLDGSFMGNFGVSPPYPSWGIVTVAERRIRRPGEFFLNETFESTSTCAVSTCSLRLYCSALMWHTSMWIIIIFLTESNLANVLLILDLKGR